MRVQHWTMAMEKQVTERLHVVMSDPQLLKVYQQFGGRVFRRSSVFHGLRQFLIDHNVRGKCAFEVGTWNGLTSVVLSEFFEKVVTIDIVHNPLKLQILEHLGIKNVHCIDISGNDEKPKVAKGVDFDFAYLDGDHAADTESDFELTSRCGRILFHECWQHQSPVWELVHSLPEHQVVKGGVCLALWDKNRT